jgi:hypothetical protein
MACALTTGYTLGCRDKVGGIEWVSFTEYGNKGSVTASSGTVTAWTLSAGQFFKYEQDEEVAELTSTETLSRQNGTVFYAQEVKIAINGMTAALRQELRLLAQNRLIAIAKFRDGTYWVSGLDFGLMKSAGTSKSGLAFGDRQGYEQTFSGNEANDVQAVSSSVITSLGL